jgi:hypothetical protein
MDLSALKLAVELVLLPSRGRAMREAPLPAGVQLLLRIAAGDETAETKAAVSIERPAKLVRDASAFFIEQMLLFPEADSYRVLGAAQDATATELRQHMALLIRWLHPDTNAAETRTIFVNRVNRAWDDLKTPERRQAYDKVMLAYAASPRSGNRLRKSGAGRANRQDGTLASQGGSHDTDRRSRDVLLREQGDHWEFLRRALSFFRQPKP